MQSLPKGHFPSTGLNHYRLSQRARLYNYGKYQFIVIFSKKYRKYGGRACELLETET
jgi:hypothetical protein